MEDVLLNIPPLTQSAESTAACPRAYVATYLEGKGGGESIPSERGHDFHHVVSRYIGHCALNQIPSDWAYFNLLISNSGPVAGPMLEGFRDRYVVDWEHVYLTECPMGLDRQFNPAYIVQGNDRYPDELPRIGGLDYSPAYCAYLGTLDVIYLSDDGTEATIEDFKTHPSIFNVDAEPQGERYAFMLFKHMPSVQKVTFKYNFVRYTNAFRFDSWNRSDMPAMQASMGRALERQLATVLRPDQAKALPCKSCLYCPLMRDMSCPIREQNENLIVTAEDRLIAIQFAERFLSFHRPLLKAWAEVRGSVSYKDGNDHIHTYGEMIVEQTTYPLDRTTMQVLKEWREASGEDWADMGLKISSTSIKPKLKAKKRAALLERFEDSVIERTTKPRYVTKTDEGIVEAFNPYMEE
jgi:hypothetical protein